MGLYEYLKHQWRDESQEGSRLPLYKKTVPARKEELHRSRKCSVPNGETRWRVVIVDRVGSNGDSSLVTAAQLATYDQIKDAITENHALPKGLATQVVATCGAGVLASVASNPIDVVKMRVMNMKVGAGEVAPYRGALDCAVKTVRTEGPMALYKGFVPTVTRQGPFAVVLFLSLEQIKKVVEG
uniref:Uncharacterized protein n=1 Tax=Physcomitrium patens TaxID=3218 RepID=A0A7I4D2N4_PHYPA